MGNLIRPIENKDISAVLEIYAPYILETVSTFEYKVPSLQDFTNRVETLIQSHPWLVCESDGEILGYAYAGPHRSRAAYQWSVESSVYIHKDHKRKKLGLKLYRELLASLTEQGFANVYAGITLPNDPSVSFHESLGFKKVGIYERIGFKFDQWRDVVWYSLRINEQIDPGGPKSLAFYEANCCL